VLTLRNLRQGFGRAAQYNFGQVLVSYLAAHLERLSYSQIIHRFIAKLLLTRTEKYSKRYNFTREFVRA